MPLILSLAFYIGFIPAVYALLMTLLLPTVPRDDVFASYQYTSFMTISTSFRAYRDLLLHFAAH